MSNIAEKLIQAVDRAIAGGPKPNTPALLFAAVVELDPLAALTKEELAALRAADAKWKKAFKATSDFSEYAAKQKWSAHLADAKLDHLDVQTRTRGLESLISEFHSKQLVAKSAMGAADMDKNTIAQKVAPRVASAAAKLLAAREQSEQADADRFGLACVPSAPTVALKNFVNGLRSSPAYLLHFVNL
jgi:hypothetical protein